MEDTLLDNSQDLMDLLENQTMRSEELFDDLYRLRLKAEYLERNNEIKNNQFIERILSLLNLFLFFLILFIVNYK